MSYLKIIDPGLLKRVRDEEKLRKEKEWASVRKILIRPRPEGEEDPEVPKEIRSHKGNTTLYHDSHPRPRDSFPNVGVSLEEAARSFERSRHDIGSSIGGTLGTREDIGRSSGVPFNRVVVHRLDGSVTEIPGNLTDTVSEYYDPDNPMAELMVKIEEMVGYTSAVLEFIRDLQQEAEIVATLLRRQLR